MKTKPWILLMVLPFFALGACENKTPAEEAADDVGDSVEEAGDKVEDAVD